MNEPYPDKRSAIATVMRLAGVETRQHPGGGEQLSGPGTQAGPLIGEAFKRAINNDPGEYDGLLKAVESLIRPHGPGVAQVVTFDPETGEITGGRMERPEHPDRPRLVGEIHPATQAILRHFEYDHLPPDLQIVSQPFCDLAYDLAIKLDGAELTVSLRKLLEGKDCAVRAELERKRREDASVGEQ